MYTVTFAGHREVYQSDVRTRLAEELEKVAAEHNSILFYVGGMGDFDGMCAAEVRALKHRHPKQDIKLVLVEPYMKQSINEEGEYLHMMYDEILIPMELAGIHYNGDFLRTVLLINPVTTPVELFRYAFLGQGTIEPLYFVLSILFTLVVTVFGIMVFNKVEKTFMDTV